MSHHGKDLPKGRIEEAGDILPELWHVLLPTVVKLLRDSLNKPVRTTKRLHEMATQLLNAYPNGTRSDEFLEVQGAIGSAASEFIQWCHRTDLTEFPSEEELAFQLIRITYNRWQRRNRQDKRLRRAAEIGEQSFVEAGTSLLASVAEKKIEKSAEFAQQIEEVSNEIVGGLNERDQAIISRYLQGLPQTEIARNLKCNRAVTARVISSFRDRVARMLSAH